MVNSFKLVSQLMLEFKRFGGNHEDTAIQTFRLMLAREKGVHKRLDLTKS